MVLLFSIERNRHNFLAYFVFAIVVTVNLLFTPHALAYAIYGHYLPSFQYGDLFPQTCITQDIISSEHFVVGGLRGEYSSDKNELVITSKSKLGKHWNLKVNVGAANGSVWQADLHDNGQADLVLLLYTGGCGMSPNSRLVFLMFDKNNMPKVWVITGYFAAGEKGIEDLRKLPGQKNAVLIEQILANDLSTTRNYWRTTMWKAESKNWLLLKQINNIHLPTYTLYTNKANHKISSLKRRPEVTRPDEAAIQPAQKVFWQNEKFTLD